MFIKSWIVLAALFFLIPITCNHIKMYHKLTNLSALLFVCNARAINHYPQFNLLNVELWCSSSITLPLRSYDLWLNLNYCGNPTGDVDNLNSLSENICTSTQHSLASSKCNSLLSPIPPLPLSIGLPLIVKLSH